MKFGIVQVNKKGLALELTENALREGAEVVLLPEKWVKTLDELPLEDLRNLAKRYTAYIIPGAVEDGVSIISPIISYDGEVKGIAKKIHLFLEESKRLLPGTFTTMFNFRGIKIGVVICYDADFPEVIRSMFLKGVEIVLVPSKIPSDGIDLWREYLRTRVLENRIAIINSNAIFPPDFPGKSIVYVPKFQGRFVYPYVLAELDSSESYMVVDVNPLDFVNMRLERLKEYRNFEITELK
ncbi:nitrilase [Sulfolobus acidocaldarius SUSAZ]|nr:nitrilase [Sulfolobus acidocaldarius SUSAZ]